MLSRVLCALRINAKQGPSSFFHALLKVAGCAGVQVHGDVAAAVLQLEHNRTRCTLRNLLYNPAARDCQPHK